MSEPKQSLELIKSKISLELATLGYKYESLLQQAEDISFSKDTLQQDYAPLKQLRELKTRLEAIPNPYKDLWADWNKARKSLVDPLELVLTKKAAEFKKLADEIAAEARREEESKARITGIRQAMDKFILDTSIAIAGCTTDTAIVSIEKALGSEKLKKNTYFEFLPELVLRIDELRPLIAAQKQKIRQLTDLDKKAAAAHETGDDQAYLDILDKKEELTGSLEVTRAAVQEKAIAQVESQVAEVDTIAPQVIKGGRTMWRYEISDPIQAVRSGMARVEVDPKKAAENLREYKDAGLLDGKDEVISGGIRYYKEKIY